MCVGGDSSQVSPHGEPGNTFPAEHLWLNLDPKAVKGHEE